MFTPRRAFPGLFVLSVILISFAIPHVSRADDRSPAISDKLKKHIRRRVEDGGATGIVVGVLRDGKTSYFAHGDTGKDGLKLDEDTIMEIGSITKAFTGMLLANAVLAGTVKLDDPVSKYLPPEVSVPKRGDKVITLEHLATHRSGLPRMPENFSPADPANPYADYTCEQLYAFLKECQLGDAPGEKCNYSNAGAGLLGHALSRASGDKYERLLRERILAPFKMTSTGTSLSDKLMARMARGHDGAKQVSNWDLGECLVAAGGIRSSAHDMMTFLAGLVDPDDQMRKVLDLCLKTRYPAGMGKVRVGLGWQSTKTKSGEAIWHNGGTGGFRSFCGFDRERKIAVVVLTNCTELPDDIGMHMLDDSVPLPTIRKTKKLDASALEEYVGTYEMSPRMYVFITRDGARISARLTGQPAIPIFASDTDDFFYKDIEARITFERDDGKKVTQLILHQNGRDMPAKRMPADFTPDEPTEIKVDSAILKEYAGKYELTEDIIFDVRAEKSGLTVQLTGQPRAPVYAESETKFFYKIVDAQITFVRDSKGKVTKLILHQNGMDQTARRQHE